MAIVFRQKEFGPSSFNSLKSLVEGGDNKYGSITLAPLNIMKSIEMWYLLNPSGNSYVPHWIGDMVVKEIMLKLINSNIPPQVVFAPFEIDELIVKDVFGENLVESSLISKFGIGENFYERVKDRLLNEPKRGEELKDPKYLMWFKENPIWREPEEYLTYFKYIALCLSGQMNPDVDDFNDSLCYRSILNTNVNYSRIAYRSHKKITKIIIKCIERINNNYIPDEILIGMDPQNYNYKN